MLFSVSRASSRQAVAAVSRLAGRNSVQMRTFLNPTVSRRGTSSKKLPCSLSSRPFVITRVRTPVRERQEGGLGVEELPRAGRTLEIASRHDLALPGRALPSTTSPCLPVLCDMSLASPSAILPSPFVHLLPHRPPQARTIYRSITSTHAVLDTILNRIDTNTAASSTADFVQELYLKELKAYKAPALKANDAEGQVLTFNQPKTPKSPEEADLASSLQEYENMAVEVEGQEGASGSKPAAAVEDWLVEEDEEEHAHGH